MTDDFIVYVASWMRHVLIVLFVALGVPLLAQLPPPPVSCHQECNQYDQCIEVCEECDNEEQFAHVFEPDGSRTSRARGVCLETGAEYACEREIFCPNGVNDCIAWLNETEANTGLWPYTLPCQCQTNNTCPSP